MKFICVDVVEGVAVINLDYVTRIVPAERLDENGNIASQICFDDRSSLFSKNSVSLLNALILDVAGGPPHD